MTLAALGWSDSYLSAGYAANSDGIFYARVVAQHSNIVRIAGDQGELDAELRGKLRRSLDRPVIGDFVAARGETRGVIEAILPRKTKLSRKNPGRALEEQVLAANVDTAFVVMALDGDYSPRRLERYLILIREGGIDPVVLLNKADLVADPTPQVEECRTLALGAPVLPISTVDQTGIAELIGAFLRPAQTIVLLGSSGVGKSSLLNVLIGEERQRTQAVRAGDQKGRHTTTHRELLVLKSGALVIDTPGLRELALWAAPAGFEATFAELGELAAGCRFSDCRHEREPGCAVRGAVDSGEVDPARYASYLAMRRELDYLERREDPLAQLEEKRRWKAINKAHRKSYKRSW
jgi:ribosome biogenesis GTPase / thiamine phosphate phosphatase